MKTYENIMWNIEGSPHSGYNPELACQVCGYPTPKKKKILHKSSCPIGKAQNKCST